MREDRKRHAWSPGPPTAFPRIVAGVAVSLIATLALTTAQATAAHSGHRAKSNHYARHKTGSRRSSSRHYARHKMGSRRSSSALSAHGQRLHVASGARAHMTQSTNWMGYNQGALEQGGKLFHSITGQWTVPTATQHTAGQAESAADWIGIGGGCVNSGCTTSDSTLIQTGTEEDVDSSGAASYSAWWELIPAPSFTITNMTVHPGDKMAASIGEVFANSNLWKMTLKDVTDGQSFSTTVPYSSTHATAEWIEETPLLIGANTALADLPNLTEPGFDLGTVNGSPVTLKPSEAMQLIDSNGKVIGTPSAPDSDADGFGSCTWSGTCTAPSS